MVVVAIDLNWYRYGQNPYVFGHDFSRFWPLLAHHLEEKKKGFPCHFEPIGIGIVGQFENFLSSENLSRQPTWLASMAVYGLGCGSPFLYVPHVIPTVTICSDLKLDTFYDRMDFRRNIQVRYNRTVRSVSISNMRFLIFLGSCSNSRIAIWSPRWSETMSLGLVKQLQSDRSDRSIKTKLLGRVQ